MTTTTMSLNALPVMASALQSRIDRRANQIREYENNRTSLKALLKYYNEEQFANHRSFHSVVNSYHEVKEVLQELAVEQKLDKVLLRMVNDTDKRKRQEGTVWDFWQGRRDFWTKHYNLKRSEVTVNKIECDHSSYVPTSNVLAAIENIHRMQINHFGDTITNRSGGVDTYRTYY